jgi:MFS family permease
MAHPLRLKLYLLVGREGLITAAEAALVPLVLFLYPLLAQPLWPAPLLIALVGVPAALVVAGLTTICQQSTEDQNRGRVFGTIGALQGAAMLIGTLAAGALAGRLGIVPVIAVQGAGYCLAGIVALVGLRAGRPAARPETPLPAALPV